MTHNCNWCERPIHSRAGKMTIFCGDKAGRTMPPLRLCPICAHLALDGIILAKSRASSVLSDLDRLIKKAEEEIAKN